MTFYQQAAAVGVLDDSIESVKHFDTLDEAIEALAARGISG
jgi:hypothetical protein